MKNIIETAVKKAVLRNIGPHESVIKIVGSISEDIMRHIQPCSAVTSRNRPKGPRRGIRWTQAEELLLLELESKSTSIYVEERMSEVQQGLVDAGYSLRSVSAIMIKYYKLLNK